jgi:hypothetical protein
MYILKQARNSVMQSHDTDYYKYIAVYVIFIYAFISDVHPPRKLHGFVPIPLPSLEERGAIIRHVLVKLHKLHK